MRIDNFIVLPSPWCSVSTADAPVLVFTLGRAFAEPPAGAAGYEGGSEKRTEIGASGREEQREREVWPLLVNGSYRSRASKVRRCGGGWR
ncbi:Hypothetical protein NTJ_03372 [Nesidiocoris tenuis]|uniref:Secreted protein n=1 Tax=Nesidiocoris tenuis TaxID=355587 RepID=A0ABN7AJN5_9HEMI|nr:Hypothetical protein NTJ_03372 [Nesidiocoris tenuis]